MRHDYSILFQVSFANVVDIDCGGLDTLATQYKLSIGSYLRYNIYASAF